MSSSLVWELVKKNNAFIKKGINGITLSSEPGNLYNVHSYKHSGELHALALCTCLIMLGQCLPRQGLSRDTE